MLSLPLSICSSCSGLYDDDIAPDGLLQKEWVKCTHAKCNLWMHEDCAERNSKDEMVCVRGNVFK